MRLQEGVELHVPSNHMDTNAIFSVMENSTLALLVLPSILISISQTFKDILPMHSAIHHLHFRKMLLVLMISLMNAFSL